MIIAGLYSFNNGHEAIEKEYSVELAELKALIADMKPLKSPVRLNNAFHEKRTQGLWQILRIVPEYSRDYTRDGQYANEDVESISHELAVKNRLGLEIEFGKPPSMVYSTAAKMTIFRNLGHIDAGIEIVPIKSFAKQMSGGVSYFEQIVWDLEQRGVSNIDIPVLIIGVAE